jgi:hypothetical protein
MLFKEFANVDAFPLCLATNDVDKIVETVKIVAPAFGAINLEDSAAPRCLEVEERLRKELDIPVFHDVVTDVGRRVRLPSRSSRGAVSGTSWASTSTGSSTAAGRRGWTS